MHFIISTTIILLSKENLITTYKTTDKSEAQNLSIIIIPFEESQRNNLIKTLFGFKNLRICLATEKNILLITITIERQNYESSLLSRTQFYNTAKSFRLSVLSFLILFELKNNNS